jgi:ParB family chromosome partitioning protein
MGKRVNLAALAQDDFYQPPVPAAEPEPAPEQKPARTPLRAADPLSEDIADTPDIPDGPDVPDAPEPAGATGSRIVPLSTLAANPLNKRHPGDDDEILEMAETIRQHGVIQPLVVCSADAYLAAFPEQQAVIGEAQWVTLIGNRRLSAARLVPLDEVTIVVNDDQVSSMYEVMLVENGQRKDLPPVLEAEAIHEALKSSGISQRELARRIGKSHMYVTQRLSLLKLIPEFRDLFERGGLTVERARQLGELAAEDQTAIYAAGPPYHKQVRYGGSRPGAKVIRVTSPAVAAESIRAKFNDDELSQLVQLLSQHLGTPQPAAS